jgi:hypothetical protein
MYLYWEGVPWLPPWLHYMGMGVIIEGCDCKRMQEDIGNGREVKCG